LVEQRIENPRVGGSIPPQATSLLAPQRPVRVLRRFYNSGPLSTFGNDQSQVSDLERGGGVRKMMSAYGVREAE
jgi:hypothetical protein